MPLCGPVSASVKWGGLHVKYLDKCKHSRNVTGILVICYPKTAQCKYKTDLKDYTNRLSQDINSRLSAVLTSRDVKEPGVCHVGFFPQVLTMESGCLLEHLR